MAKNKKAWMKILEAFIAILFIIGILSIVIFNETPKQEETDQIHKEEIEILRMIEVNNTLRQDILEVSQIPLESSETNFPEDVNDTLDTNIPLNFDCRLKICLLEDSCELLNAPVDKEIYIKSIIINSNLEIYSPRILEIFCWEE